MAARAAAPATARSRMGVSSLCRDVELDDAAEAVADQVGRSKADPAVFIEAAAITAIAARSSTLTAGRTIPCSWTWIGGRSAQSVGLSVLTCGRIGTIDRRWKA
jgi:hypothetical protein